MSWRAAKGETKVNSPPRKCSSWQQSVPSKIKWFAKMCWESQVFSVFAMGDYSMTGIMHSLWMANEYWSLDRSQVDGTGDCSKRVKDFPCGFIVKESRRFLREKWRKNFRAENEVQMSFIHLRILLIIHNTRGTVRLQRRQRDQLVASHGCWPLF